MPFKLRSCAVLILALAILPMRPASTVGPVCSLPWLHEGLMLTYAWDATHGPGSGSDYSENANGQWIDKSGKPYAATPPYRTSGSGWNEITVACIDGDRVVLSPNSFTNAGELANNDETPPNRRSFVAQLNDPGDYWMDPAELAAMRTDAAKRIVVMRGPWTTGGYTTDTIRVQVTKPQFYSDKVYDAKTGLCIHWAYSFGGMAPLNIAAVGSGRMNSTLKHGDLVGTRDLTIPWAKDAMPDWTSDVRSIEYQGSSVSRGSKLILPVTTTIDMTTAERGDGWIAMKTKSVSEGAGPEVGIGEDKFASGRSQFGGMWIGTASIGLLLRGYVLDYDPITKMKTSVTQADEKSVTISAINAAGESDWQYDTKTGMLIRTEFYDALSKQQMTMQMLSHK
jgi:hypothetical protein